MFIVFESFKGAMVFLMSKMRLSKADIKIVEVEVENLV
jgi:hypothetical protein